MPSFDPELIALMRRVLDEAMASAPPELSSTSAKAYLAECILKAAAAGKTSYWELMSAATDQIQTLISMIS
jgi:hypothetical protein